MTAAARVVACCWTATALACGGDASDESRATVVAERALYGGTPTGECRWANVVALDQACTGVLIHREVVVYAAHCGVSFADVTYQGHKLPVAHCAAFPEAQPGGSDIAFCRLRAPIPDAAPAAVAAACEAALIAPGSAAQLVGYGQSESEAFGTRREVAARVEAVGAEYRVYADNAGTCFGDSGGPLFVVLATAAGSALRVAGVLSSKEAGPCPEGRLFYTKIAPFIGWIETTTGLDLTPCTAADGSWAPGPDCVDGTPAACEQQVRQLSSTCGAPFDDAAVDDMAAPDVDLVAPAADAVIVGVVDGTVPVAFALSPRTSARVREVRVDVTDAAGSVIWREVAGLQPWNLRPAWLRPGAYVATLSVEDYRGTTTRRSRSFVVRATTVAGDHSLSCSLAAGDTGGDALGVAVWLGLLGVVTISRRRAAVNGRERGKTQPLDSAENARPFSA